MGQDLRDGGNHDLLIVPGKTGHFGIHAAGGGHGQADDLDLFNLHAGHGEQMRDLRN
ncbi:hypothetical protein SDC9_109690 [bioreactor metagenome]|uniref:Uncharacterized protein n=1 Tax=bioreactor metagenome TaxID=1076179 RepID=A0A645BBW5_9ZZZZ